MPIISRTRPTDAPSTPRFPIRVAARRSGVSAAALRAWERRYGALTPARTDGEQRLYSEVDIERIRLLRGLTVAGHAISGIAKADTEELRRLLEITTDRNAWMTSTQTTALGGSSDFLLADGGPVVDAVAAPSWNGELEACMRAVMAYDDDALHHRLRRAVIRSAPLSFIEEIAAPLCRRIGDEWAAGNLSEAQERSASSALRRLLSFLVLSLRAHPSELGESGAPTRRVLVTTLRGERHENGALMAAVVAVLAGRDVIYSGADLPAAAIAGAARHAGAEIVAVSVVNGTAPRLAQRELTALREELPARTRLVVGGAAAPLIDEAINAVGASRLESLAAWCTMLSDGGRAMTRAR